MSQDDPLDTPPAAPTNPGERLRAAREARGLTLADIAAQTRVPLRNLEGIERSDYSMMPSLTYAIGFARAYARAVGVDEVAIARDVRGQSGTSPTAPLRPINDEDYEIADVRRGPSRGIVIAALAIAAVLLVVLAIRYGTGWLGGPGAVDEPVASAPVAAPAVTPPVAVAPAPATGGQVVLTATDEVWLKVRNGDATLFQGTLQAGDHFDVPATATAPLLTVGRPDKLRVTLNGSALPSLGDGRRALNDVPIDGAALAARASGQPAPSAAPSPAAASVPAATPPASRPTARPTPRATPRATPTRAPAPTPSAAPVVAPPPASVPAPAPAPVPTAG